MCINDSFDTELIIDMYAEYRKWEKGNPKTLSETVQPQRCLECGYELKQNLICPVCNTKATESDEELKQRLMKRVRRSCYESNFHGKGLETCKTLNCETCKFG